MIRFIRMGTNFLFPPDDDVILCFLPVMSKKEQSRSILFVCKSQAEANEKMQL